MCNSKVQEIIQNEDMGWFAFTSQSSGQCLGDNTSFRRPISCIQSRLNKCDFICLDQITNWVLSVIQIIHQGQKLHLCDISKWASVRTQYLICSAKFRSEFKLCVYVMLFSKSESRTGKVRSSSWCIMHDSVIYLVMFKIHNLITFFLSHYTQCIG